MNVTCPSSNDAINIEYHSAKTPQMICDMQVSSRSKAERARHVVTLSMFHSRKGIRNVYGYGYLENKTLSPLN